MIDWYNEAIEEGVRDIVHKLRDVGINTNSSCHHDMTIQCESYDAESELHWITTILLEAGFKKFRIEIIRHFDQEMTANERRIDIYLPDKDGKLSHGKDI